MFTKIESCSYKYHRGHCTIDFQHDALNIEFMFFDLWDSQRFVETPLHMHTWVRVQCRHVWMYLGNYVCHYILHASLYLPTRLLFALQPSFTWVLPVQPLKGHIIISGSELPKRGPGQSQETFFCAVGGTHFQKGWTGLSKCHKLHDNLKGSNKIISTSQ